MTTREKIKAIGGPRVVARMLGITTAAVSQWQEIPVQRAVEIERLSGGKYSRAFCRPDVFGPLTEDDLE